MLILVKKRVWGKGYNSNKGIKVMFGSGMNFYFNNES